ncbi:response regulator [Deinococcus oregonensis]|uniref:Response regulator n=1 Tax=Deinococcus oregonensis TaxID=1805970 RepID=A0ABV6B6S9_9DEIO
MIRVALVDDQTLVRQGFRRLLELAPDMAVVAEAGRADEALTAVEAARPDVLLLDVRLPDASGLQVLRSLAHRAILPPTLMLTTFPDDQALLESLRLGASGFLLKDVTLDELLGAIRFVAGGGRLLQPALSAAIKGTFAPQESTSEFGLTGRELELLGLMAGGYNNRELAELLNLTEGTVKNRVSSVLSKLGVRDRSQAVLRAMEHRLLR